VISGRVRAHPLLERMRTDQMVPLGAALAALTMARGTLATILTAAAIKGLPAAVLAPGLLAFRATAQGRGRESGSAERAEEVP